MTQIFIQQLSFVQSPTHNITRCPVAKAVVSRIEEIYHIISPGKILMGARPAKKLALFV